MGDSLERDPCQLDFREKKIRLQNFLFVQSIYTILKNEKVNCAKLFFTNIDFTTPLVVSIQEVKNTAFWYKENSFCAVVN